MQLPHADAPSRLEVEVATALAPDLPVQSERAAVRPRRVERVDGLELAARCIVWVATSSYALVLCWGIFGRIGAGHEAIAAARGIVAENMATWHVLGPVRDYTLAPPTPAGYYTHHPWGTFWYVGLLGKLFGRHVWVPRLAATALSVAIPPMLYGIGRRLWGVVPGALAALAYVVLPITLTFGNLLGFEEPLCFGLVLTTWGYLGFTERWKRRWMAVSLLGVLFTANVDWVASVFLGAVLGALLLAHFWLPPRWFGRVPPRRFAQWWAWAAVITVAVPVAYWLYFAHIDAVAIILAQEAKRSRGNEAPLAEVLAARRTWIDGMFTPLAILIGKIAAPVFLVRLLLLRRIHDVFPLAILATGLVHYLWFKQGADVHIYWPLPFAPYFALSVGVLAAAVGAGVARLLALRTGRDAALRLAPLAVLGAFGTAALAIVPDGVRGLVYGRRTGGRFNDRGRLNFRETDKAQALEWMGERLPKDATVALHGSMHPTWSQEWSLHRPTADFDHVPVQGQPSPRYFAADLAFMNAGDQVQLATRFHVTAVGQYAFVDCQEAPAPADAFVFDAREPTPLEWYFVSGIDPVRTLRADAWQTWELRDEWGQTPNPPPRGDPASVEQVRIAHNVAVARGDAKAADALAKRLESELDASVATEMTDGTKLLGRRYTEGVAPALELYFLAAGPSAEDVQVEMTSEMLRAPTLSLVPNDDRVKQVGMPLVTPPRIWKAGYLYVDRTEIDHRPGNEVFWLRYAGGTNPPHPVNGEGAIGVLTLPR